MPHSNPLQMHSIGGTTPGDDDDDDRGKEPGSRTRNSISSTRMSSLGSPTPSQLSIHSLSPASSNGYLSGSYEPKKTKKPKKKAWYRHKTTIGLAVLLGFFFLTNWWMLSRIQEPRRRTRRDVTVKFLKANSTTVFIRVCVNFLFLHRSLCNCLVILVELVSELDSKCIFIE